MKKNLLILEKDKSKQCFNLDNPSKYFVGTSLCVTFDPLSKIPCTILVYLILLTKITQS